MILRIAKEAARLNCNIILKKMKNLENKRMIS